MFRLYAQPAGHLAAIGGVNTAYGKDRYKKKYQQNDAERFRHPVVKRIILVFSPTSEAYRILFHNPIALYFSPTLLSQQPSFQPQDVHYQQQRGL